MCLTSVAGKLTTGINTGLGNGGKVDMRRDVLQSRQEKRIVVNMMPIVTHQRPAAALWVIVLGARKAVIDQQQRAAIDTATEIGNQMAGSRRDFADIRRHNR